MKQQGFISYVLLGLVAALAVTWLLVIPMKDTKIDDLNQALGQASTRVKAAEQELVSAIQENNQAMDKLKTSIYEEREQCKLTERNYAELQDDLADSLNKAEEEKQKYEAGRLARVAAAKGGLLTRLAKTGAEKRNGEWEALAQ